MAEQETDFPLSQETFRELWGLVFPLRDSLSDKEDELMSEDFSGPPADVPLPDVWHTTPPPSVPSTAGYSGELNFQLCFRPSGTTRAVPSTFSPALNKLFCQMGKPCPIDIKMKGEPPAGAVLRATAVYKQPEHIAIPVRRCPHHENISEYNEGSAPRSHLIRVEGNTRAVYVEDSSTLRQSVLVPYEPPEPGAQSTTLLYSYMCHSSCVGGMNRRPILTIITLETHDGHVLGRQSFEVRVCACPGRDRRTKEENLKKGAGGGRKRRVQDISPSEHSKIAQLPSAAEEVYTLLVHGKERYMMLKKINDSLELTDMMSASDLEKYKRNMCPKNVSINEAYVGLEPKKGKKLLAMEKQRNDVV